MPNCDFCGNKKEELEECPHCGSEYCEAHPCCENCELEPWAQEEL